MKNRIWFVLLIVFLATASTAWAQKKENPYKGLPFKERIFLGGDLGFVFGDITFIRVAPLLGYNVSERFAVGAGPSYQYYRDRRFTPDLETSIYGGSVFGRYFVLESIFLQTEFEYLNLEEIDFDPTRADFRRRRVNVPVWLVGGGFSQRTASGSGFFVAIMYDLISDINSPYPNDIVFRAGGFFGF